MTRYLTEDCLPSKTCFVKVYNSTGHCFAGYYYAKGPIAGTFAIGPRLDTNGSLLLVFPPEFPTEWEEWR